MFPKLALCAVLTAPLAGTLPAVALGDDASGPPEARLLRFPDIHGDFVVFVYGGDLWRAPVAGGPAMRLTAHPGLELFPKVSPDGRQIAFSAEYSGTRQVYVMPAWGGEPKQLTYYNDVGPMPPRGGWDCWVQGWTPDGKILVRLNRVPWSERMGRYHVVDPQGGLETPLPLFEGGSASLSPDGRRIAYTPVDREFRTWKRHRGGRAQDVWIYDLDARRSERLTDHPGSDNFPMWAGDTLYFTSDREHTLNVFAYDLKTKATRKVTDFEEYDVLWPSLGAGAIVFMNGGYLYRLDLASEKSERIPISLASEATTPYFKDVRGSVQRVELSPSGARVVFEARGELFSVPAKDGATRNLTETGGVRERDAAWSPDGKWIAYLSDAGGEYDLYLRPQAGGPERRLTTDGGPWRFRPAFSPDSRKLAFGDRARRLRILDLDSGAVTDVDRGSQEDLAVYTWSPDSRWLAYEKSQATRVPGIAVYSLEKKKAFPLGDGLTFDGEPVFSGDGKHLFFVSLRDYAPSFSDFEFNYVYRNAGRVYVATLAPGTPSLFPPKSDEEKPAEAGKGEPDRKRAAVGEEEQAEKHESEKAKAEKEKAESAKTDKKAEKKVVEPVTIVPEGFEARTQALPGLKPASYRSLQVSAKAVFYLKGEGGGGDDGDGEATLYRYDLEERKEEAVISGVRSYALSRDGKKLLYRAKDDNFIVDAKAGAKAGEGKIDLAGLRLKVEPRAEWVQMFADGWRIARDWFYDEKMHGVDWKAMRQRYGTLLPHLAHRADLDFLFGEMLGELESGHTYVASGDEPKVTRVLGGLLGCELAKDASGRYRIAKVYAGENWDEAFRSPLTEPGVEVPPGSFLLAIDGHELSTTDNPYRLLEGKAAMPVVLKVSRTASGEGAREVTVRPISSERGLFYLDWVRSRMALAHKLSGGKVGYVHLPDTAFAGNRMLQTLFYAEAGKPALIVDDRYNGGGFIPDRMIEYFSRRTLAYWARRSVESMRTPGFAHDGPKAMLINGYAGSGGDALPYFFRLNGLGPLIGTRTWGGLIGLAGNPQLADGGSVQIPSFRIYDRSGKWVVENEGVAPDIEVFDLPENRLAGGDPSLEKAVEVLLAALAKSPVGPTPAPVPPDMTK